jgi:DNA helicase-2/ATP-dependent DNA helicase PcrA
MQAVELPKDFPKKEVIAATIGKAQNTASSLMQVLEASEHSSCECQLICEIAERYTVMKKEQDALDFDDLLVFTLQLFKENPNILSHYAQRFEHVLVDEFQDTNIIQSQLVDALASHHQNVMAVGDDFQCIYSWRGANFRNIMDFPVRWPGCQIIKLERNYRSVPEVLTLANACIKGNPEQFEKTLCPTRAPGRLPLIAYVHDAQEQAQMVLRYIQRAFHAGYRPQDIAILYRSHFHVMELELALRRQRMNYELTSGQGIFESVHAKDVIAYLKLASGHADMLSFIRVLCLLPSVGEKTADRIWVKMGYQFDASNPQDRIKLLSLIPAKAKSSWTLIDETLHGFWQDDLSTNGNRAITRFLEVWYAAYLKRTFENAEDRANDVAAIAAMIEKGREIGDFLAEAALMTNLEAEQHTQGIDLPPGIRLSTIHQAKGLEWPVVILLWCNEEMFPSAKALKEGDDSEERRLFYVALTRAKDELLLCVPSSRRLPGNGNTLYLRPSRFVKELPPTAYTKRYGVY